MADLIRVRVGDTFYDGWKSANIERSLEQLAGSFELSVSEMAPGSQAASELMDGAAVTVLVGSDAVLKGYIDDVEISHSATSHEVVIRGREATADLVDCSALHHEWNGCTLQRIVNDLVLPYGIQVTRDVDTGEAFAKWSIEAGETVFENIDKLARHRGVLVTSDGRGSLLLTAPGDDTVGTALVLGQNILSGSLSRSQHQRFSEYRIYGQRQRDDNNSAQSAAEPTGKATDATVTRLRRYVCCYEDANATISSLNKRASWQAKVNAARAQRVGVTVQGWRHADGVWEPNKLVTVSNSMLRLDKASLLISGVRYVLDEQGSRTELSLAPRNAYLVDVIPDEVAK